MSEKDYPTQEQPETQSSQYNALLFMMEQVVARISTATLVKIAKATSKGEVAVAGQVDITPLVKMQDRTGKTFSHDKIHSLPYLRYQSGTKAIIMDPKVGDIGIAVFVDRDISSVKTNKKEAAPGSHRRFDMADGMFIPAMLGEKPTSYVQFEDDGTINFSPDNGATLVKVKKDKVQVTVGTLKFIVTKDKVYLNCDVGEETARVQSESGPIPNVLCKV